MKGDCEIKQEVPKYLSIQSMFYKLAGIIKNNRAYITTTDHKFVIC